MSRHGKNATASSVYSYHERRKDSKASGYGSTTARIGKDSLKEFDCCCLTLQPCRDPVVTPDGWLYDKEAILEYIIQQKREIARKLKEYDKQKHKLEKEQEELAMVEYDRKVEEFKNIQKNPITTKISQSDKSKEDASVSNMSDDKKKKLPSFWIPSLTPDSKEITLKKPEEKVRCPMSQKPIRLKDLIPVKFTAIQDRDTKTSLINKDARYVCAVTNDVLGNATPCAVLRKSGCVVTMDAVEKLVKIDMRDPINGSPMTEKDIIQLQRGASGFAGSGASLIAKKKGIVMPLS